MFVVRSMKTEMIVAKATEAKVKTFRVPIMVSVAPVQTYRKTVAVEAVSRQEAADILRGRIRPGNSSLSDAISSGGWKALGRLGAVKPDRTYYDTYLDERSLDEWVKGDGQ
jgi:hypothetical protein